MNLLESFRKWQKKRKVKKYYDQNRWHGFIPGDVVECKSKQILYLGINQHGGPGMAGIPEPIFGPPHPRVPVDIRYYLRPASGIFSEDEQPVEAGNTGVKIAFINATPSDLKKIDHITPARWQVLKEKKEEFISLATRDEILFVTVE